MKAEEVKANKGGFTIVELLTVMGIIAILIGLLAPALTMVRDYAKEIQQKAQFHAIEAGINLFQTDFGSYPDSEDELYEGDTREGLTLRSYSGANKLAEAMVGLDFLGFHPKSDFWSDGDNVHPDPAAPTTDVEQFPCYHADYDWTDPSDSTYDETAEENIQARKGPYVELERSNAFIMQNVYETTILSGLQFKTTMTGLSTVDASLVLCDVFSRKRSTGKKTGMPILYFRARTNFIEQDSTQGPSGGDGWDDDIYNLEDNANILALGTPKDRDAHPLMDNVRGVATTGTSAPGNPNGNDFQDFDDYVRNSDITVIRRPRNAESYILISAGKDGLYGTPDDITNFQQVQQ